MTTAARPEDTDTGMLSSCCGKPASVGGGLGDEVWYSCGGCGACCQAMPEDGPWPE